MYSFVLFSSIWRFLVLLANNIMSHFHKKNQITNKSNNFFTMMMMMHIHEMSNHVCDDKSDTYTSTTFTLTTLRCIKDMYECCYRTDLLLVTNKII